VGELPQPCIRTKQQTATPRPAARERGGALGVVTNHSSGGPREK
jgi:hypothetical protein